MVAAVAVAHLTAEVLLPTTAAVALPRDQEQGEDVNPPFPFPLSRIFKPSIKPGIRPNLTQAFPQKVTEVVLGHQQK